MGKGVCFQRSFQATPTPDVPPGSNIELGLRRLHRDPSAAAAEADGRLERRVRRKSACFPSTEIGFRHQGWNRALVLPSSLIIPQICRGSFSARRGETNFASLLSISCIILILNYFLNYIIKVYQHVALMLSSCFDTGM